MLLRILLKIMQEKYIARKLVEAVISVPSNLMLIPTNRIIVNKQKISEEHVDDFVDIIERGRKVKPITVRECNQVGCTECATRGLHFVLVDGRHRLAAHKALGKEMIEAMVTL